MQVFFAIPTANPVQCGETFALWKDMGYMTAAMVDDHHVSAPKNCDVLLSLEPDPYSYPRSVNRLCQFLIDKHDSQVIVTGGDDVHPDPNRQASDIACEFFDHFKGSFGVMQPTGDRWMMDGSGRSASERVCPSPWLGRELVERINGGAGPFWPGYYHFYSDEELHDVAEKLGILWQRLDLTQHHDHWQRNGKTQPSYLHAAQDRWQQDQALFNERKASGFSGHEQLVTSNV